MDLTVINALKLSHTGSRNMYLYNYLCTSAVYFVNQILPDCKYVSFSPIEDFILRIKQFILNFSSCVLIIWAGAPPTLHRPSSPRCFRLCQTLGSITMAQGRYRWSSQFNAPHPPRAEAPALTPDFCPRLNPLLG